MRSFTTPLSLLFFTFLRLSLVSQFAGNGVDAAEIVARTPHTARQLAHGGHISNNHRRKGGDFMPRSDLILYPGRRAPGAHFTWFVTGLGACGGFNGPNDFIVAMSKLQFDATRPCGAKITIRANGKTAQATIVDRCESCGYNDLDLTEGLYRFFDPSMFGSFTGDWEFGGAAQAPITTPKPVITTPKPEISTPKPVITTTKPTSTKTSTHISTTTSTTSTTSTSTSVTTSSATSTSSHTTSASANSTAANVAPIPTPAVASGNIELAFQAFIGMGSVMMGSLASPN